MTKRLYDKAKNKTSKSLTQAFDLCHWTPLIFGIMFNVNINLDVSCNINIQLTKDFNVSNIA